MPVNVASGSLDLEYSDVEIAGVVALTWDRKFSSSWLERPPSSLGDGWMCQYFSTLRAAEAGGFDLSTPSGTVHFEAGYEDVIQRNVRSRDYGSFSELFRRGDALVVQRWDIDAGCVWRYCFPVGARGETLRLASIENASNQGLDLAWEGVRLVSIRQRLERGLLRVAYNERGLIGSLAYVGPSGAQQTVVRYEYDARDHLAAVFDAAGFADRYESEPDGRIRREMPKDGAVFRYVYDQTGRCVRTTGLDEYDAKSIRYLEAVGYSEVSDSYGKRTIHRYNRDGQIIEEANPLGAHQAREYDEYGRVVAKTDANGATAHYEYDDNGDRVKIVDAVGNEFGFRFNQDHLLTAIVAPTGHTWVREYSDNRLVRSVDPTGGAWVVEYDAAGLPRVIVDPNGFRKEQHFERGRLVESSDREGHWSRYAFDDFGRLAREIDPNGGTYAFSYDAMGNLVRMVSPDGTTLSMEYDQAGNATKFTDQEGNSVVYRYGPCKRLLEQRDRTGNLVRYRWGTEPGRLLTIVNGKNETFELTWDDAGQLIKTKSFDGLELTFDYDPAGRTVRVTNGASEVQQLTRDALGRLVRRQLSTGDVHTFEYDALSNVVLGTTGDHVVQLIRDPLERIVKDIQDDRWAASEYDGVGKSTRVTSSFGADIAYQLDGNGTSRVVSFLGRDVLTFTRDVIGQEVARQLSGGVQLTQQYDARGLLRSQALVYQQPRSPQDLIRRDYQHDARGLLRQTNDLQFGSTRYDYDPSERLIAVAHGNVEERWRHDPAGNVIDVQGPGTEMTEGQRTYGPGNRLLRAGRTTYEYDGNGRLIRKIEDVEAPAPRVWRYRWDALSFLTAVITPEGREWRYTYDAFGRRLSKSGPTGTSLYVWNRFALLHEVSDADTRPTTWILDSDSFKPLAQVVNGELQSIITDQLGTPTELIDGSGRITRLNRTGISTGDPAVRRLCALGFQGQLYDEESGFFYNRFRYYDPDVGRYITQDPRSVLGGLNLYLYCPDPLRTVDPLGLDSSVLDRALGGTVGDGKQAHHIIPEQVMNQNADMIKQAQSQGFQRDGKSNGILLPSDDAVATAQGVPSHRGSHPQYNAQVGAEVAAIRDQWKSGQISNEEMLAALNGVQEKWRKKIENNDEDLPRGKKSSCKLG